ncbi:hypothetical protein evm_008677 [Chilo suppressalis]|nr:hypothetical protein evm_008677 [Chilo suppressalis]
MVVNKLFECFIVCFFLIVTCLCEVSERRIEEGYPRGYLSECVGSTRPAIIPQSELKYLNFWMKGNGIGWKMFPYHKAKNMAKDPRMNPKKKTMLIVLGYLDSVNWFITPILGNEYERRGYNIITIDFERFMTLHYFVSSRIIRPIGKLIAEVLVQMTQDGLDPAKLEMIGLSLGGHTMSYIAKNYQQLTGRNISKLTGLDPAGPCFRHLPPEDRLAASDADFVEVMHFNIEGYGMAARMGHVDIYVNGGEFQPGNLYLLPCSSLCSHFKLLLVWLASMKNPDQFIALKCDSIQQARDAECYSRQPMETNLLGPKVNQSVQGIFYLSTSPGYPYFLGTKGLDPEYAAWKQYSELNSKDNQIFYT